MKTELQRRKVSAEGFRFALVVSRWNREFTSRLEGGANEALTEMGVDAAAVETFYVPGSFEIPVACLKAARTGRFDAVIALGVVIRGDTPHFDYVAGQAAAGILQASLDSGIPVMFGVITADNVQQVTERTGEKADNKGYEAAVSAVEMVSLFRSMEQDSGRQARGFPHVA
ncbi:MAG: 6,7-dimethyl-8-ribityllumazine synthase [Pyrinomonadaceae bacterium]|nr:6,7-dimethyl-8-ribityllumazine synthase [Pyrinomonadaceae bacterium]